MAKGPKGRKKSTGNLNTSMEGAESVEASHYQKKKAIVSLGNVKIKLSEALKWLHNNGAKGDVHYIFVLIFMNMSLGNRKVCAFWAVNLSVYTFPSSWGKQKLFCSSTLNPYEKSN